MRERLTLPLHPVWTAKSSRFNRIGRVRDAGDAILKKPAARTKRNRFAAVNSSSRDMDITSREGRASGAPATTHFLSCGFGKGAPHEG